MEVIEVFLLNVIITMMRVSGGMIGYASFPYLVGVFDVLAGSLNLVPDFGLQLLDVSPNDMVQLFPLSYDHEGRQHRYSALRNNIAIGVSVHLQKLHLWELVRHLLKVLLDGLTRPAPHSREAHDCQGIRVDHLTELFHTEDLLLRHSK